VKLPGSYDPQYFTVLSEYRGRKSIQIAENTLPMFEISTREFAQYKRMHEHQAVAQKRAKLRLLTAKMGYPDRGIR